MIRSAWLSLRRTLGWPTDDALPDLDVALHAAADWIARAQDATPDGGVSAFYDGRRRVWAGSYPETTGYIIPTFFEYAARSGRDEFFERAIRMAHWESDIQLSDGAVRAGTLDSKDQIVPTIFNTGQVLFGWAAAYRATGDSRFAESLRRACDWLLAAQDDDGAWRRYGSPFCSSQINTYNTRVAFGLVQAAEVLGEHRYTTAAIANIEWALRQRRPNGWFDYNDLDDNDRPLTHTIAYALRGIMEVGIRQGVDGYVAQAAATARCVADRIRSDGSLPGRFDDNWRASGRWSCLTGNVQMAGIWLRLSEYGVSGDWHSPARRCIAFTQTRQKRDHPDEGVRGAIPGSAPLNGQYMPGRYPNWAARFFMDALMNFDAAREPG
ncbi:pectate lyase [Salinisphaera sp. T31B1]|uniref:pectate lyase n=1 Tax=Salinisphaera sp. T31B1 TaxID=727963 RepID=UPI00334148FD